MVYASIENHENHNTQPIEDEAVCSHDSDYEGVCPILFLSFGLPSLLESREARPCPGSSGQNFRHARLYDISHTDTFYYFYLTASENGVYYSADDATLKALTHDEYKNKPRNELHFLCHLCRALILAGLDFRRLHCTLGDITGSFSRSKSTYSHLHDIIPKMEAKALFIHSSGSSGCKLSHSSSFALSNDLIENLKLSFCLISRESQSNPLYPNLLSHFVPHKSQGTKRAFQSTQSFNNAPRSQSSSSFGELSLEQKFKLMVSSGANIYTVPTNNHHRFLLIFVHQSDVNFFVMLVGSYMTPNRMHFFIVNIDAKIRN